MTYSGYGRRGHVKECLNLFLGEFCFWERDVAPWYERSLMVRWVFDWILHGGLIDIELFLVPRLV